MSYPMRSQNGDGILDLINGQLRFYRMHEAPPGLADRAGPWMEMPDDLPSEDDVAEKVRTERNRLLSASDWTQVADAPVDQAAWASYRQALRDIPEQPGFPHDVAWPVKP